MVNANYLPATDLSCTSTSLQLVRELGTCGKRGSTGGVGKVEVDPGSERLLRGFGTFCCFFAVCKLCWGSCSSSSLDGHVGGGLLLQREKKIFII